MHVRAHVYHTGLHIRCGNGSPAEVVLPIASGHRRKGNIPGITPAGEDPSERRRGPFRLGARWRRLESSSISSAGRYSEPARLRVRILRAALMGAGRSLRLVGVILDTKSADAADIGLALSKAGKAAVHRAAHGAAILSAPRVILRVGCRACERRKRDDGE